MSHKVYKYTLDFGATHVFKVKMPVGAKALCVGWQQDNFQIWAWVDASPNVEWQERTFAIVGTGFATPSPEEAVYVGTVIKGMFIWHIFERTPP